MDKKLVDDFNIMELSPLKEVFIRGANFIHGHTQMQKRWGMGYQSPWALKYFKDRKSKNEFFISSGRLIVSSGSTTANYEGIDNKKTPDEVLACLKNDKE